MIDKAYPHGVDFVWVARDKDHHVAVFVTGGAGPVPTAVLLSELTAVEDVESPLRTLPQVSATRLLVPVPRPDDFIALAERGFFVYDWRDVHRTARESTHVYECVAVPARPVFAELLPDEVAQLSTVVTLNSMCFASEMVIDIRAHTLCIEAE